EPGSTVAVTNPDGTTETVTAGTDGSYTITTPANQPSGDVVVVATDAAGNISAETTIPYVDATAPDAPTAEVTVNADGSLTVAGVAEAGSTVSVTNPDGTTENVVAGEDGSYTITTPANQPSGDVVVVATDAAGNVSAETTVPYVDATAPDAPTAEVTVNADGSLTVAGTSEPGSTVAVTNPDGTIATVTAGADGSYTITTPANQPSGDVVVVATDAAGNISAETTVPYVDATAPDAPTAELTVNADGSLTVAGVAEAGSTVSVTNPDGTTENVVAGEDGSYTITTPANQPSGDVVVVATDAAGNVSAETTIPYVDATAPNAPTAEVTVNADGSLTVAGTSEPGSTVSVTNPDGTTETVTAGGDGSYTITTSANQPSGDVVVVATDAAGNISAETTVPYVDATAPDAPTAEVTVNADGSLTVAGTSEPGSTVSVTNPDGTTETVVAGADGSYTITTPANQPSGDVVVVATDAAGNVSAETTVPYVDATAPDAPTAEVTVNADGSLTIVGTSEPGSTVAVTNPDGTTETVVAGADGSYTITTLANQPSGDVVVVATDAAGNVSAETTIPYVDSTAPDAPTAEVTVNADGSLTVAGTSEPGSTVSVTNPDGTTETVTAGADGSYTITSPINQPTGDVVVIASDAAGNVSAETTVPYVDTIAPTTTATIDSFSDDVGLIQDTALPSGSSTDDSTPTLNGSLTAELLTGEQVNVYRDGTLAGQATVTGTNWTFTDSDLADAPYTYVARVVDASGNLGDVSSSFELTVDTSGPSSSTTQVTIDAITGDDVINAAESSDVVTITGTISGDYSVGDVVTLTTAVGTYTGAVATGGTWSVEVAAGGFGGNGGQVVQVSILAHDIAGNPGTVTASRPYLVNISAPSGTALSIDSVAGDDIVNASEAAASNTETISGSVTGEFTVGDVVTLTIGSFTTTAAVDANGLWSTTVAGDILAVGTAIDASLLAHNAVGNEATVTASRAYVVDTDLPSNSSTTISFDPITDDNIVNAAEAVTTLTLSGLVSGDYQAGDVITLTINGVQYSGSVAAGGIWTVANVAGSDLAADADRIIDASLVAHDNAGNEGTVSASHNYAVQTDGVTTGLSIDAIAGDNIINNAEALSDVIFSGVSTGTFTEGDVVTLTVNGTAYTTSIDADGIWSVSVAASALGADGAYTATASIVSSDSAGNLGSAQAQRAYSIDTAVPDASSTSLAIDTVAGDDQVNLAESSAAVQHVISGTVSGDFTPGDIVTVTIGSESYSASVTAGSGSTGVWSVSVAGDVLASATTVIASLAASDAAGNVGTILAQHNYVVDITVPNAPTLVVIDDAGSVTGNVADNGGVTDDNTPTYQGTGEAGATINLVINGAAVISVLVDSDGNWSYTAPLAVADGDYTVVVTQADTAGNVSAPVSTTFTVSTGSVELPTLVVSDNLEPVLGLVVDGGSTNDITPTFSGTGVAGATVHVAVNGGTPVDVTVDASGEWSYTPSEPIGTDGSYTVSVTQTTAVGTSGAVTSQFILDTRAPSAEDGYEVAITSYTDDVEPQAGVYLSGSTTNDTSPLLSGTVAGLVDGDEVHIYQGRTQLGVATVSDGNWIYQVTNVSEGTHSYTAVLVDSSGNLGVVSEPFIITVDITAPSAADGYAVAITGYVDDVEAQTGVFLSGTSTNDTSPLLQGSVAGLAPGDQVHIYSGTELLGTASVTADTWTFQISEADEGTHNYTAVLVDAAGNQGLTSEVFTLTVDTIAPSEADGYAVEITGYIDDQEEQIGTFGLGTTTNDTSPLLQGTVSGMIAGDTIRIYDGSALIGTASVQGGTWSYAVVDASEGSHTYTAVVVDAAGNEGLSSNAFTLIVDTSAPSAEDGYSVVISSFADDVEAQVGNFPSGSSTNDTSPLLQGSVEGLVTGDFVRIYEGSTLLGTAVVTGENWVFQLADVTEGSHSYVAVLVDAAGNQGLQSDVFSLVVDTRAPNADDGYAIAIIDYVDDVEAQTGTFASGTTTNDTSPVLQGSVFGLVAGDLIRIYDGSSLLGVATVSGDTWSYEVVDASEGTHAYTAVLTDAAGNEGLVSNAFELTVDTQAPSADDGYAVAIVSYTDSVEAQTGTFGNGTSTNDQSPVLNGTVAGLVNGDLVRIYEGTTLLGTAAVSDGTWTFEVVQASEGQHDYTAVLVDAAGNQGLSSEVFSLTVDTTAPSADNGYSVEIVSYIDDVEAQVGSFGSDTSTNDSSPLLQGTVSELASDEFVRIYDGEILLGTASVNGTVWTYQVADAVQGEHIYTARVVDAAGNEGVLSNAFTLTVDTTAPSAEDGYAIAITAYTDDVEVRTGDFGSGTSTNDPEPLLRGTVSGLVSGDVVRIYEGSTLLGVATVSVDSWTYQLSTITEGLHTYTAVLADAAGNEGLASNAFSLTLDTSVPSEETGYRVAITGYVDDVEAQTGTFVSGTSTNDTSPLLQGTVSGLVDGDDVLIYQGENLLGAATVTGATWAFQVLGLTEGTYTFTAVVADGAGHQGLTSSPLTLTVDRTAPSTEDGYAVAITSYVDNQEAVVGVFGSDTTTNDTSPLLQGTVSGLVTGDEVRIYENGTLLGTAAVFGSSWFYQLAQVSEGAHTYTAILADAAGNEGLNSAAFTLNVDTTAPSADDGYAVAITAFADVVEAQVGDFPNGSSTNDTSPQLKGSVAGLVAGDVVRLYEGANLLGTATVTDGEWLYQLQGVSEGTHTYTAMVVDAAGNEGLRSSEFTLTVDTRAPSVDDGYAVAIIDYVDDVAAQVGSFGSGTATNDTSPVLQGSVAGLTTGDVVRIYESGTLLGVATVSGDNWNYELASVSEGLHTYTAVLADAAGNEGVVSNEFSLIVDTTAPSAEDGYSVAIISYTDDVQAQTGIFGSGTSTNDLSPVLNGTVAGLANGDLVRIYEGTQLLGTATVTAGTWTFEVVQASEGSHTYTAVLADAAGNEGVASNEFTLTVDTRAPSAEDGYAVAITTFTDDVETLVGDYPSGTWTNDNTPLLQGTVEGLQAGDYVRIYQDMNLLGNATVTDGTWVYQVAVTADGSHNYVAVVVDGAGNEGLISNVFNLIIDTVPPTQTVTIDSFTDDFGTTTGNLPSGSTTDDATPVLNGSLSGAIAASDTVSIYEGTTLLGTATVTGTTWSFAIPPSTLIGGTLHTYTAVISDLAGNQGTPSNAFSLTSVVEVNVLVTLDTTPIITGRIPYALVDGARLHVTIDGKTYTSEDGTVMVDSLNSTWYIQIPNENALSVGTHPVLAEIINGDGSNGASGIDTNELIVAPIPVANFGAAGGDGNNKGTTVTMSNTGGWEFFSNQVVFRSTGTDNSSVAEYAGTSLTSNTGGAGYGNNNMNMVQNATYIDINRDGHMDIVGIDSRYSNGQQMFINNGDGTYTARQMADTRATGDGLANTYSWYGGVMAIDFRGDGYVDVIFGDQTPNDAAAMGGYNSQFVQNNAGVFIKDAVYTYTLANGGLNTGNATPDQELSGVDLNNDGTVDVVFHATAGTNKIGAADATGTATSGNTARLVVVKNNGAGGFTTSQIINDAVLYTGDPNIANEPSMTWADYNGDGYMDLFMGRVHGTTVAAQNNSTIFFNDGAGNLASTNTAGVGTATGTYKFNDTVRGGASLAVDWNGDGRMDIIEAPQIGEGAAAVTGTVNLYTNQTSGGTVSFNTSYLQTAGGFGSAAGTARTFSGAISAAGVVTGNPVTGMLSVDVDYDGAKDLLLFTSTGATTYVRNTNVIADGTSMHVRIVDPQGITTYFGNTVKLVNSAGVVVSTQIINPQAGGQTNDSTSIVDFYGLNPNETYSIILLRNINGVTSHVGASSSVAGFTIQHVNSSWGGLKAGEADSAYVLTAQGETESSNTIGAGVIGTGYNDTFFATLGTKRYEGGGGTTEDSDYKTWSNTGGMDIVDFKLAGSTALTIDMSLSGAQNTGWNTVTLSNIEGIAGAAGNDTFTDDAGDNLFEGRGGNDTFNLINGGRDTLLYKVLAGSTADGTGGNGTDTVNGFSLGTWEASPNADRIDLSELLVGYTAGGGARYINGVATIASNETIGQFISVATSNGNTTVSIDRDGNGSAYSSTALVTLNGVSTDLATLLANHQLVVV
ncbi:Ig-like domain-containing protein, partial [Pseudomonas sp. MEJ086]